MFKGKCLGPLLSIIILLTSCLGETKETPLHESTPDTNVPQKRIIEGQKEKEDLQKTLDSLKPGIVLVD